MVKKPAEIARSCEAIAASHCSARSRTTHPAIRRGCALLAVVVPTTLIAFGLVMYGMRGEADRG